MHAGLINLINNLSLRLLNSSCVSNTTNCACLFYYRTMTVLGCVVHNRAMFYKNMLPKTRLTDY